MVSGRLFHKDGPATEKARRPYRSRLYRGIVNERWAADLSERVGAWMRQHERGGCLWCEPYNKKL